MHPALIPGDDKDDDFARKMVSLAVHIVRGGVFERAISMKGTGPLLTQEVIFVPRMKDEEGA